MLLCLLSSLLQHVKCLEKMRDFPPWVGCHYYLHEEGREIASIYLCVCVLFVYLFVCEQNNLKSYEQILTKISGNVDNGTRRDYCILVMFQIFQGSKMLQHTRYTTGKLVNLNSD